MTTRKEQKELKRQIILFAGLDLFVAKGYEATKISDIAQKASISMGLLFHYFESKEKLYEELVKMGLEGTRYPMAQKLDSAILYFEQFTEQLFSVMQSQPYVAKMFALMSRTLQSEGVPENSKLLAGEVNTIDTFVPIIIQGQQEGTIRTGDALALSNAFWCSIQGVAEQYVLHPEIGLPEAEWIVDIVRTRNQA